MKKRQVVVTTDKKGVFFGTIKKQDTEKNTIVLTNARMCIYWPVENHGVLGLASDGPADGSRITPAVKQIELNGVTAVMDCTDAAVKEWEVGKWK